MKKSTVYVAYVNSDLTEGRGRNIPFAICKIKSTAIRLGKGKNVQGSNAFVKPVDLIEIVEKGIAKWYAPIEECIWIHLPNKMDLLNEKLEQEKRKTEQKAKDLGLTKEEIKILKGEQNG